jgi:argonaute-like protein implicated in RNA metabolism and viral defense
MLLFGPWLKIPRNGINGERKWPAVSRVFSIKKNLGIEAKSPVLILRDCLSW